jgi:hypothetical protein
MHPLGAILSTADLMPRRGALPELEYKATARIASSAELLGPFEDVHIRERPRQVGPDGGAALCGPVNATRIYF